MNKYKKLLVNVARITCIIIGFTCAILTAKIIDFKQLVNINSINQKHQTECDRGFAEVVGNHSSTNEYQRKGSRFEREYSLCSPNYRRKMKSKIRMGMKKMVTVIFETSSTEETVSCTLPKDFLKKHITTVRNLAPRKDCTSPPEFVKHYETTATLLIPPRCTTPKEFEQLYSTTISTVKRTSCTPDADFINKWKTDKATPTRKWMKTTSTTSTTSTTTKTSTTTFATPTATTSSHIIALDLNNQDATRPTPKPDRPRSHIEPFDGQNEEAMSKLKNKMQEVTVNIVDQQLIETTIENTYESSDTSIFEDWTTATPIPVNQMQEITLKSEIPKLIDTTVEMKYEPRDSLIFNNWTATIPLTPTQKKQEITINTRNTKLIETTVEVSSKSRGSTIFGKCTTAEVDPEYIKKCSIKVNQ